MDESPDEPEKDERPMSFLAAAGWTLVCALVATLCASLLDVAHPGALHDVVTLTAVRVLACSLVFFVVLRVHEPESSIRRVLALRWPGVLVLLLAIIAGAALVPVGEWMQAAVEAKFPAPPDTDGAELFLDTPAKRAIAFASLVAILPVVSELFFRGALFTPLKRGRRLDAVVFATAAYDALFYQEARFVAAYAVLLLAVGFIRGLTASVIPAIAARVAFAAIGFGAEALGHEIQGTKALAGGGLALATASVLAIAALARRDERTIAARVDEG